MAAHIATVERDAVEHDTVEHDAVEHDTPFCVICQTDITSTPVNLKCGHVYCGQCITDYLISKPSYNSLRCPTCREDLQNDSFDDDSFDDDPRLLYSEAFNIGKRNKKTCKNTRKMFDTIKRWKTVKKDANRSIKELRAIISRDDDAMQHKIDTYIKKMNDHFYMKNKDSIDNIKYFMKEIQKAHVYQNQAKMRIAVKHGYVRPRNPRRSYTYDGP
jgi:hypothetical protein